MTSSPETEQRPTNAQNGNSMENYAIAAIEPYVENRIYLVRDQKVMMDFDAAEIYEVDVRDLIKAVRRNIQKFPVDFMFRLTPEEFTELKEKAPYEMEFQRAKSTPYVFTQEGLAMLAQVLKSSRATQVNLTILREFVKMRQMCASAMQMASKMEEMEKKYDQQFGIVFKALKKLEDNVVPPPERHIGFQVN